MLCPKCGEENREDVDFCQLCLTNFYKPSLTNPPGQKLPVSPEKRAAIDAVLDEQLKTVTKDKIEGWARQLLAVRITVVAAWFVMAGVVFLAPISISGKPLPLNLAVASWSWMSYLYLAGFLIPIIVAAIAKLLNPYMVWEKRYLMIALAGYVGFGFLMLFDVVNSNPALYGYDVWNSFNPLNIISGLLIAGASASSSLLDFS